MLISLPVLHWLLTIAWPLHPRRRRQYGVHWGCRPLSAPSWNDLLTPAREHRGIRLVKISNDMGNHYWLSNWALKIYQILTLMGLCPFLLLTAIFFLFNVSQILRALSQPPVTMFWPSGWKATQLMGCLKITSKIDCKTLPNQIISSQDLGVTNSLYNGFNPFTPRVFRN